jgi:cell division protein ZapA
MAQVVVTIAGRTYRMACEEGQEKHIEALAWHVDAKMAGLKASFGEIGEQRLVTMAAITVADELFETKSRIEALEAKVAALEASARDVREAQDSRETFVSQSLATAADRIEILARMLAGKG